VVKMSQDHAAAYRHDDAQLGFIHALTLLANVIFSVWSISNI
jgi:hypothetical protein